MLEVGCDLDLCQETLRTNDCGQFRLQDFEGDIPIVLQILGEVHRSHAAFAKLTLDGVAAF